jgi:hypothetical protein
MQTQEQIEQSMRQIEADNINLDYSKWSFERRRAGLPTDHELWQDARDTTLRRQQAENAELGRKYLAKLDEEKKAAQDKRDAENKPKQIAAEASLKSSLRASYMATPAATNEDFERDYPQLRSDYLKREAMRNDAEMRESQRREILGRF